MRILHVDKIELMDNSIIYNRKCALSDHFLIVDDDHGPIWVNIAFVKILEGVTQEKRPGGNVWTI